MIHQDWQAARRILLIRLDNLGDVLVTTPAFHAVRESLPLSELTLLTSTVGARAGALNPDLDSVWTYPAPWTDPWSRLPQDPGREQAMISRVSKGAFDAAIIFGSFHQSPLPAAYLCYLSGIPLRLAASIDGPGSLLTTRHRHPERTMHEVERGLDLVSAIGIGTSRKDLVLTVPSTARAEIAALTHGNPLVVLHPGCTMPARTYPPDLYASAADELIENLGATVLLTGTEDEKGVTASVGRAMRHDSVDLAGKLSFPALCALIEAADLTLTNNTGPMHISAALKTPVVALFALTNPPEQWGPWRVPHRMLYHDVPCRLCYQRVCPRNQECLRDVSASEIVTAARELLGSDKLRVAS
ncbi:MAG: glycosyltransferase family 9 protein [Chloroflexota bacterium]